MTPPVLHVNQQIQLINISRLATEPVYDKKSAALLFTLPFVQGTAEDLKRLYNTQKEQPEFKSHAPQNWVTTRMCPNPIGEDLHGNFAPMTDELLRGIMLRVKFGLPFAWVRWGDADSMALGNSRPLTEVVHSWDGCNPTPTPTLTLIVNLPSLSL